MNVLIDLIVPTIPGREDYLERCVSSYIDTAEFATVNPIIVRNSKTCGWGWRTGFSKSYAPHVLLACDDQECIGPGWDMVAITTTLRDAIPCPRVHTADGGMESYGGDMNQRHHLNRKPLKDRTSVDYTTIPFLKRSWMVAIGMHDWHYTTDVWISYRARQLLNVDTILRHGFEVVHHQALVGRGAGMDQAERDAMDEKAMREELAKCES